MPDTALTREQFIRLIAHIRCNGSYPDGPLLLALLLLVLLTACGPADPIAEGQTPPPLPAGQWLPSLSADTPGDLAIRMRHE